MTTTRQGLRSSVVTALGQAVLTYDPMTAWHSTRVSEITSLLAAELDLDEWDREIAGFSGVIHDIGKLGIPRSILNKTTRLTTEERKAVEEHSALGANLLLSINPHQPKMAEGVRAHHERWDGEGYPDGLKGEEIPLLGRMLSVIDVYDAMTNRRIYRKSVYSSDRAKEYLEDHRGTQFDPVCVDAAITVLGDWLGRRSRFSLSAPKPSGKAE